MKSTLKYLPIATACVAIFIGSCKNDKKENVSTKPSNGEIIERIKAEAFAQADSLQKAKMAAQNIAKTVSFTDKMDEEELFLIDKSTKSKSKPISNTNTKPKSKTHSTNKIPSKTTKSIVPSSLEKNSNTKKRKGKDDVWMVVESQPTYPGGTSELSLFLKNNLKYPSKAKEEGIKGTVFVRFVVEKNGLVTDIDVPKSVHPLLDLEAKRVVRSMPMWTAGTQKGQPVATQYTLPVKFVLIE